MPLVADAQAGLSGPSQALAGWEAPSVWIAKVHRLAAEWNDAVTQATAPSNAAAPSDAQVLGAVNRAAASGDIVVCASGGLPGELHKLWRSREPGTYHVEYGYSCMVASNGCSAPAAAPRSTTSSQYHQPSARRLGVPAHEV